MINCLWWIFFLKQVICCNVVLFCFICSVLACSLLLSHYYSQAMQHSAVSMCSLNYKRGNVCSCSSGTQKDSEYSTTWCRISNALYSVSSGSTSKSSPSNYPLAFILDESYFSSCWGYFQHLYIAWWLFFFLNKNLFNCWFASLFHLAIFEAAQYFFKTLMAISIFARTK